MQWKTIFFFLFLVVKGLSAQNNIVGVIGFYNVENLFDTENDQNINDEDFLPDGVNKWNEKRYGEKLANMSRVIGDMGTGPDIMGLSEVENRRVIEDLVQTPKLKPKKYQIIHFDSPDGRGIDVALIYKVNKFKPITAFTVPVRDENSNDFRTRDILWVKGLFAGDTLHIAVNHWPSRRGGKEDKRILAATVLRNTVDSVLAVNSKANIITMGDFNDDPINRSIKKVLDANMNLNKLKENSLYNCGGSIFKQGYGSLYYRGAWNLFDQIMVSKNLLASVNSPYHFRVKDFYVFVQPYMQVKDGEFKGGPFRTFSRGVYQGGFSDHFPVLIYLTR
ncbi:MAG: endonuclease/exonuclease/phosphatase family protein [Bacteroidota bacterium]